MKSLMVCLIGLLVSAQASLASLPVISGQVRLTDGSPVAGAQVLLFDLADLRRGAVGQAITDEAGQFALPLATLGRLALPQGFALGQNYPNPFNPATIIPYQLAATSQVRLDVFNTLGQRMATLVNGNQEAGSYQAQWDGTDAAGRAAAAGLYFYRLTVEGAQQTGRMVLVDGQAGVPMGGGSVEVLPMAVDASSTYGLVVSGSGIVTYVDADFGGAVGMGSVDIEVEAGQNVRMKVARTKSGILGDVNNNGQVDIEDGLVVAMYSVNSSILMPNNGDISLGDVNCNGQVDFTDARLIVTYIINPSDSSVQSLSIGQSGGCASGGDTSEEDTVAPSGSVFQDCGICPYMVVVPAGSFTMGSPNDEEGREENEGPQHLVTIKQPLAVGLYEVTFDEWDACVNGGGCEEYRPSDWAGRGSQPVIRVSWDDAQAYLAWLSEYTGHSYRLLSESEWEYAARAGTTTPYFFGETISHDEANYYGDSDRPTPVGTYPANAFGLYDMHGNVLEWVQDCWNSNYTRAPDDGTAWERPGCSGRVLRGGDVSFAKRNIAQLRSARRYWLTKDIRESYIGFRVARTLTGPSIILPGQTYSTATDIGDLVNVMGTDSATNSTSRNTVKRFTLSERSLVQFGLNDLSAAMDLYLDDESDGTIAVSKNRATADESITYVLNAGTYYVRVVAVGDIIGRSYDFTYSSSAAEVITEDTGLVFQDCEICPYMVVVPAGSFIMGSPNDEEGREENEGPQHLVTIKQPLAVGLYEVTFDEWDACVNGGGCEEYRPSDWAGRGSQPVIRVSWDDAQAYLAWLSEYTGHSYRLLSESEWEYAARAGTTTPYFFGETISHDEANYYGDSDRPTPVGTYPANAFGLYDMHGNVLEWVQDCWNSNYTRAPDDGTAWERPGCSGRVLRGGDVSFAKRNIAQLRSARRYWLTKDIRESYIGFRVAREYSP